MDLHKTLERQIIKLCGSLDKVPSGMAPLLEAVSKTYDDYDDEYKLMERSLNISSEELTSTNGRLLNEVRAAKGRAKDLEGLNEMMIDRELKMVELKKQIVQLKHSNNK